MLVWFGDLGSTRAMIRDLSQTSEVCVVFRMQFVGSAIIGPNETFVHLSVYS